MKSFPSNCSSETSSNARWNTRLLSSQWIKIISFVMNLSALKLFCEINWLSFDYMLLTNKFILYHVLNVLNVQFCLIFTLPSQIWAFIWGLPDFLVIGFKRLASASISFYLCFCAKNLVLPCPSLLLKLFLFLKFVHFQNCLVTGEVPLAELSGYSKDIR